MRAMRSLAGAAFGLIELRLASRNGFYILCLQQARCSSALEASSLSRCGGGSKAQQKSRCAKTARPAEKWQPESPLNGAVVRAPTDRITCRMSDRLYYADPSLASFDAHVSDIREVSRSQGRSLWQIALDRSAFYPTSGGQPHDTGLLTATSSGGALLEAPILAVEEDEQGEVWHTTPKPLLAGTAVRGYVDWSRRRDHMQQHSGQHLLSAVVYRQLGAATVSFHLGEMTSTIDLAREAISPEELERVEDAVNEIIAEDRAITMRTIPRRGSGDAARRRHSS